MMQPVQNLNGYQGRIDSMVTNSSRYLSWLCAMRLWITLTTAGMADCIHPLA